MTLGQAETMTAAKVKRGATRGKGSDVEAVDLSPFFLNFLLLFILFFMEGTLLVITDQEIVMKNDIPKKIIKNLCMYIVRLKFTSWFYECLCHIIRHLKQINHFVMCNYVLKKSKSKLPVMELN